MLIYQRVYGILIASYCWYAQVHVLVCICIYDYICIDLCVCALSWPQQNHQYILIPKKWPLILMSIFPEESNLTPIILWWISRFLWSGRQTLATNSLDWQMWRKWFVTCRAWLGLWEEEHTWHSSMVCGTCRRVGERVFALLYNSKQFSVESQQHLKFKISVLNQHAMYILWRFSRWPSKNDQKLSMKSYTVNMFDGMRGLLLINSVMNCRRRLGNWLEPWPVS